MQEIHEENSSYTITKQRKYNKLEKAEGKDCSGLESISPLFQET